MPSEYMAGKLIDRFGAPAVYGRPLGYGEMRRIMAVESIVNAYQARARSSDWAKWASENPEHNKALIAAMKAAHGDHS